MPKPGYTGLTLKQEIAQLLRQKAQQAGIGINQLLIQLLQDGPRTVPTHKNPPHPSLKHPLNHQYNRNHPQQAKREATETAGVRVAGPLGFEPRTSGSAGQRPIQTRPRALRKDGGQFLNMKFSVS